MENAQNQSQGLPSDVAVGVNNAELTFGMKAVGLTFNPSGHPAVDRIKRRFADIIDDLNEQRHMVASGEAKRYFAAAITEAEKSQMLAVKAITWQY